jgi:hypothetical protein
MESTSNKEQNRMTFEGLIQESEVKSPLLMAIINNTL